MKSVKFSSLIKQFKRSNFSYKSFTE